VLGRAVRLADEELFTPALDEQVLSVAANSTRRCRTTPSVATVTRRPDCWVSSSAK
jgi:hypothetical protein